MYEFMSEYEIVEWLNPARSTKGTEIVRHKQKMSHNLAVLQEWNRVKRDYPSLDRVIGKAFRYLHQLNVFGKDKWINQMSWYPVEHQCHLYFFGSSRFFARKCNHGDHSTWNRNINIFCTLGLVVKLPGNVIAGSKALRLRRRLHWKMAMQFGLKRQNASKIKPTNFYIIPLYDEGTLTEANRIATVMLENGFRKNGFSKIFLIRLFGQEFADKIFPDDRYVSAYSDYVAQQIAQFILRDIEQNGYTTKNRVLSETNIDLGSVSSKEYGFGGKKAILAREFDRSINWIVRDYDLMYGKANKELVTHFSLDSYRTIIFRPCDVSEKTG